MRLPSELSLDQPHFFLVTQLAPVARFLVTRFPATLSAVDGRNRGRPYVPFSASAGRTPPGSGGFHYISSPVRTVSIVPVVHPDRLPNLPGGLASTQSTASAQVAFAAAVPSAISGSPAPALAVSVVPAGGGAAASESSPPKKRRGRGPGKKKVVVAPPVSGSQVSGGLGGRGRGRVRGRGRRGLRPA